jgi:CheY-like chemotaxis protein
MKKILLIDDDPDVRTVMTIMLQKQGYQVTTASRKEEAWQMIEAAEPAVILLDVLLSGADGRDLCREIKANPQTRDIPVIMFSGHPSAGAQFQTYGADDFITKPLQKEVLLEKLSNLVQGRDLAANAAE